MTEKVLPSIVRNPKRTYPMESLYLIGFVIIIVSVLLFDLLFVGRKSHILSVKEALLWTSLWISLALSFYFFILYFGDRLHSIDSFDKLLEVTKQYAPELALSSLDFPSAMGVYLSDLAMKYLTGYVLEYTLSIDNVFVIMMILETLCVPIENYKKVLFWGILGAIVMRFLFIFIGSALIQRFDWILLLFGVFLLYSGVKMFLERNKEETIEIESHFLLRNLSKYFKVHPSFEGDKFLYRNDRGLCITPLLIVLVLVEFTDLIFAFDSIPAIFSVSRDPYIVFFSNIFAIIGLRSLFFLFIRVVDYFHYLKVGVSFLLAYVGLKLLFHNYLYDIGFKSSYSLIIILATLIISVLASLIFPKQKKTGC
jgi:tellurite resistance protein TerC